MHNPYARPEADSTVALARADAEAQRTHRSRITWLGVWNVLCGLCGLLLTLSIVAIATEVGFLGAVLWLAFWTARTVAGAGMFEGKAWSRWLAVGVHALLTLSGVASVVGLFGLWVLLSEGGGRAYGAEVEVPPGTRPQHSPGLVLLLVCAMLANWAVPLWFFIFVLGPMV